MYIQLINRTSSDLGDFPDLFEKIAANAERKLDLSDSLEVSVLFVRSASIHKINREYRDIDKITDVITFAARDENPFLIEEEMNELGDIFINIDYARAQARQYGHSYEREICFLFTHGLLHCLGYDHMNPEDEKIMFALQDEILDPVIPRL